jgi:hypothetical protein
MGVRDLSSRQPKAADTFVCGVEYAGSAAPFVSFKEIYIGYGEGATDLHLLLGLGVQG